MTIREKANNYAKSKNSDCPKSIIECYECAYLQAESDLICKLFETKQFTMSKIAEMLDKKLIEVMNAISCKDWV